MPTLTLPAVHEQRERLAVRVGPCRARAVRLLVLHMTRTPNLYTPPITQWPSAVHKSSLPIFKPSLLRSKEALDTAKTIPHYFQAVSSQKRGCSAKEVNALRCGKARGEGCEVLKQEWKDQASSSHTQTLHFFFRVRCIIHAR